jgi:clan AA aspartic protease
MGLTHATITLKNGTDQGMFEADLLPKEKIRTLEVKFLVDTGAFKMAINEKIAEQLGLKSHREEPVSIATGEIISLPVVGPINVEYLTRQGVFDAFMLPGETEPLFGAFQMEALDLIVDPIRQQLRTPPDRPYQPVHALKGFTNDPKR